MLILGFCGGGVGGDDSSIMKWYSSVEESGPIVISKVISGFQITRANET